MWFAHQEKTESLQQMTFTKTEKSLSNNDISVSINFSQENNKN